MERNRVIKPLQLKENIPKKIRVDQAQCMPESVDLSDLAKRKNHIKQYRPYNVSNA